MNPARNSEALDTPTLATTHWPTVANTGVYHILNRQVRNIDEVLSSNENRIDGGLDYIKGLSHNLFQAYIQRKASCMLRDCTWDINLGNQTDVMRNIIYYAVKHWLLDVDIQVESWLQHLANKHWFDTVEEVHAYIVDSYSNWRLN
jgi:hypothetical protein